MASKNSFGMMGKRVAFNYRSKHGAHGTVTGIVHQGTTRSTTTYAIRPSREDRHPGEPSLIHRKGANLTISRSK